MCVGDGFSLDSTNQTSETWMMNSPRALAEKIRKELRTQPELKDQLSQSLDRLILFLKPSEHEARNLRLLAGFSIPGFQHLSISTDENIYDVLDTYELGRRLKIAGGSWESAWDSISNELNTPDPVYGAAASVTLERLRVGFDEIREASGEAVPPDQLFFENFVRDSTGKLLILL